MTIGYNDLVDSFNTFVEGRNAVDGYSVDIQGELAHVSALDALDVLDNTAGIRQRAEFCRKLLKGCTVTVKFKGALVASFTVTEGFQWFAVPELDAQPYALKFVISAVYSQFLKRCAPSSQSSKTTAQTNQ